MRTESDSTIRNLLSLPVKKIAELTQMPFRSHPNKFAELAAHGELVFAGTPVEENRRGPVVLS
jgi:hypothetical protein